MGRSPHLLTSRSLSLKPEPHHRSPPTPGLGCLVAGEEVKASSTVSDTLRLPVYITKAQETFESLGYPSHPVPSPLLPTSLVDWKYLVPVHSWDTFVFYTFLHLGCSVVLILLPSRSPPDRQFLSCQVLSLIDSLFYCLVNDTILFYLRDGC